jgi:Cation/multidrug efflux pump
VSLVHLAVRRPVTVAMAVLALILFGGVALQGIGVDLLPNIELPVVAVITLYPGADPATVEADVTNRLEELVATVPGLTRMRSSSAEHLSIITAEFEWGADLTQAMKQLENNVAIGARLLPQGAEPPIVLPTDPSQLPVMMVAVAGAEDPVEVTRRVETYVKPRLQQVPGVAGVEILGGSYQEISVRYDSAQLQEHGITPTLLYQVIAAQNMVIPAGSVVEDGVRYHLKAGRTITDLEALKDQPVAIRQGLPDTGIGLLALSQAMPVRLREVADVTIAPRPREGATRVNGQAAVIVRILKQSGENSVQVSSRVREALAQLEQDESLGLRFFPLTDQADLVGASLSNLSSSAAIGAVLATAVLLFFLRSARSIAVIATAIPLSILGALVTMRALNVSLNMMSLGGLAVAVGMLVDNAIVVLENIVRHRESGANSREAAIRGGSEIASAIVASTLTTLIVFVPIFFVKSLAGVLFRDTGIAVTSSLLASLAVALVVVPVAASKFLGKAYDSQSGRVGRFHRPRFAVNPAAAGTLEAAAASEGPSPAQPVSRVTLLHRRLLPLYKKALSAWTSRRWLTPVTLGLCLILLLVLPGRLETEFLPPTDGSLIVVRLDGPPSWSASETLQHVIPIEEALLEMPEVVTVAALVGDQGSEDLLARATSLAPNQAQLTVVLQPKSMRRRSAQEIAQAIAALDRDPRFQMEIQEDRTVAALGDDYFYGLTVELSGPDLETLQHLASQWAKTLAATEGFHNVTTSVDPGKPELFFHVSERSFQSILGGGEPLTAAQVGLALRNHLTGVTATYITLDGQRLPVVLRPAAEETESVSAVREFRVPGAQLTGSGGQPILDRIATVVEATSMATIHHRDRMRVTTVRAELDGISLEAARTKALQLMEELPLPPGYRAEIVGIHRVVDESLGELSWVLVVALILVYTVMAAQFESLGQPLIILVTVPLAGAGALALLWASGHALGVPAIIGLILLAGVAVNNAIVMIDRINGLRKEGLDPLEAIHRGAMERLRPILMTSITSIFGLIPLALSLGEGSELQAPMAVAVIGGLITSTFLSLFVIPGLLAIGVSWARRKPEFKSLGLAMVGMVLLMFLTTPVAPAQAATAPRWGLETIAGAAWLDDELHPLVGVNASLIQRFTHYNFQASGGLRSSSPWVVSVASGHYFPDLGGAQLSFRSDWWLNQGNQWSLSFGIQDVYGSRLISLTHATGDRPLHPWSGQPSVPEGGHLESWRQIVLSDAYALESRLSLHFREGSPPSWLLLSGGAWRETGLFSAEFQGGVWLRQGRYDPLIRLGTTIQLLPAGSVEVAVAPIFTAAPLGWPVARLSFQGQNLSLPRELTVQWVNEESGVNPHVALRLSPAASLMTINLRWSPRSRLQGLITVERAF